MANSKPRVIKSFEKLDEKMREMLAEAFPGGFQSELQSFDLPGGKFMWALPFETDEYSYLIKFPVKEAVELDEDSSLGAIADEMNLDGADLHEEEEEEYDKPDEESVGSLQDLADAEDNF